MGLFDRWKDDSNDIRVAVEVLSKEGWKSTEIAEKLDVPVQRVTAFLKTVGEKSVEKGSRNVEQTQSVHANPKVVEVKTKIELLRLQLEEQNYLKQLEEKENRLQKEIEKVKLDGEVLRLEDKKKSLDKEIQDKEAKVKELDKEIDELEEEADKLDIAIESPEQANDPMGMLVQGFMQGKFNPQTTQATAPMQTSAPVTVPQSPPAQVVDAAQQTLIPEENAQAVASNAQKDAAELVAALQPHERAALKAAGKKKALEIAGQRGIPRDVAVEAWKLL